MGSQRSPICKPIGIVIMAIAALVAIVVLAYKKSDTFRAICDKVWGVVKKLAGIIKDALVKAFNWVIEKIKIAWEWLKKFLGLDDTKTITVETKTKDRGGGKNANTNKFQPPKTNPPRNAIGGHSGGGGHANTNAINKPSVGLIAKTEDKLEKARNALREATSEESIKALREEITQYEKELDRLNKIGAGAQQKGIKSDASTLKDISTNIDILTEQLQTANLEEAAVINKQIKLWRDKEDAIKNAGLRYEVIQSTKKPRRSTKLMSM